MADTTGVLTGLAALADRVVIPKLMSKIYTRAPLLALIAAMATPGSSGPFGPGNNPLRRAADGLIGGSNVVADKARREQILGNPLEVHVRVQTGGVGGHKFMGARDTGPTISSPTTNHHAAKTKTAKFRHTKLHSPLLLWNTDTEVNPPSGGMGQYGFTNVVREGSSIAFQDHVDALLPVLYDGLPSDQTAEVWDSPFGLSSVCGTDNSYGGIDRTAGTFWDGRKVTDATAASLDMVDQAHIDLGVLDYGDGATVMLCHRAAYHQIKAEALAKGGSALVMVRPGSREALKLGLTREAFWYGSVLFVYDPWLKNYYGNTDTAENDLSTSCMLLTLGDFVFQTMRGFNFRVPNSLTDLEAVAMGGNDAKYGLLKTHFRWWCEAPWNQVWWTTVTTS